MVEPWLSVRGQGVAKTAADLERDANKEKRGGYFKKRKTLAPHLCSKKRWV